MRRIPVQECSGAKLILLLGVVLLLVACGGDNKEEAPSPTEQPTATIESTITPTEEAEEGRGVVRTIRGAPGAAWGMVEDGAGWVWGQISRGGNSLWDGIRGTSISFWNMVTGLPSDAWNVINRFFNWIGGTMVAEAVVVVAEKSVETIKKLNPTSLMGHLISYLTGIIGRLVLVVALASFIVWFFRWQLWRVIDRLVKQTTKKLRTYNEIDG